MSKLGLPLRFLFSFLLQQWIYGLPFWRVAQLLPTHWGCLCRSPWPSATRCERQWPAHHSQVLHTFSALQQSGSAVLHTPTQHKRLPLECHTSGNETRAVITACIFIAELWGGWHPKYHSTTWDVWPSLWVPPNLGYSMIANDAEAEQTVPASGPYQHDGSPSMTFPQLPAFNLIATSQLPAAGVAWGQLCLHCLLFLTVSFTRKLPLGSGLQAGSYYCLYSFCWKPVLLLLEETLANPSSFFKKEEYVLHKISSFPLLPGGEQRKTNKILNRKLLHLSWKTVPFPSIECLFCHTAFQFVTMKSEETNFVAAFFLIKTTLIGNFYWAYPLLWSTGQWNH